MELTSGMEKQHHSVALRFLVLQQHMLTFEEPEAAI